MFQVRIHGRGGQGVVTAAELLSVAAFSEGRHSQAFPSFGSERTGAPVVAFCRIDDKPIRVREPVADPDALIVQDATLLHQVDLFSGVGDDAYVIVNTGLDFAALGLGEYVARFRPERVLTVAATDLARRHVGRAKPNAALLGAFAGLTGVVDVASVADAIRERFTDRLAQGNVVAAEEACAAARGRSEVAHHA